MAKTPYSSKPGKLLRAVAKLDPVQREVLFLSAVDDLRNHEIAVRLRLPVEEVERHLSDALCRLDRELQRPWWQFW